MPDQDVRPGTWTQSMQVIVFEAAVWEAEACSRLMSAHKLVCTPEPLSTANVGAYRSAEVITTFIHSRLDAAVLAELPRVKLIATRSTGYDHIDLDFCAQAGIVVTNVPDYGDVTVAEHVFTLLLALTRNLLPTVEGMRSGRFDQSELLGTDLNGKAMGVIGTGRIGRRVIGIAQGFGMAVLATDARPDPQLAAMEGFRYTDFETLLRQADVISLHVPANAATQGMIGEAEFAMMRPGAILINTARGNIVDAEALVRALTGGHLRGAGLDVFPEEPLMRDEAEVFRGPPVDAASVRALLANHVLMQLPNVIMTPHIAYNTREARARIIEGTMQNIEAFAGGTPENVVSPVLS